MSTGTKADSVTRTIGGVCVTEKTTVKHAYIPMGVITGYCTETKNMFADSLILIDWTMTILLWKTSDVFREI